jgi:hypothetical protein
VVLSAFSTHRYRHRRLLNFFRPTATSHRHLLFFNPPPPPPALSKIFFDHRVSPVQKADLLHSNEFSIKFQQHSSLQSGMAGIAPMPHGLQRHLGEQPFYSRSCGGDR